MQAEILVEQAWAASKAQVELVKVKRSGRDSGDSTTRSGESEPHGTDNGMGQDKTNMGEDAAAHAGIANSPGTHF